MTKKRTPPRSRAELRPVDKMFIHKTHFDMGILPIEDPTLDMRVPLRQLPVDEARVIKRKFRKQWRKAMKAKIAAAPGKRSSYDDVDKKVNHARATMIESKLGKGKHVPSRHERQARKQLVFDSSWNDTIVPMLIKFENPERGNKE